MLVQSYKKFSDSEKPQIASACCFHLSPSPPFPDDPSSRLISWGYYLHLCSINVTFHFLPDLSEQQPSPGAILRLNPEEETERIIEIQRIEIKHLRELMQGQETALALRPAPSAKLPILEVQKGSSQLP